MVPVEIITYPCKKGHLCRISVGVLHKDTGNRLNSLRVKGCHRLSDQRSVDAVQFIIMVITIAGTGVNCVFLGREVLVEQVGVIAPLGSVIPVEAEP